MTHLAIFLVGLVGIAYQIALMRIFSIAQWYHFAYMIISICMLGFSFSGTLLALVRRRIAGREALWLSRCTLALVPAPALCYALGQMVPFESFRLLVEPIQSLYLLWIYLAFSLPFALVSACITLGFMIEKARVGKVYFVNMAGSGLGALVVILLLYRVNPVWVPYLLAIPAAVAHLVLQRRADWLRTWRWLAAAGILLVLVGPRPIRMSEYKGLSHAGALPDAEVLERRDGPMSQITVLSSSMIRETPGQISNYPMGRLGPLPEQIALFFDGGGMSVVNRLNGEPSEAVYLDYVGDALPYRLLTRPEVFIVGAGGGTQILNALYHRATHVTAVEADPNLFDLMEGSLHAFSGGLYTRPEVTVVHAEGRGYLQAREKRFDLIQLSLLDSFNASSAGVRALNEDYLYTLEAMGLYLDRLAPEGMLAISRWLKSPPRDTIKMAATLIETAERAGIREPARHLVVIRTWNTATLLLSKVPLSAERIAAVRAFCAERHLDICWLPDLRIEETNRYTILETPEYFQAISRLLSAERESFYRNHLFDIRPATDDRPYFFRFFRWKALPELWAHMGTEWIPFVEWGYLTLIVTLLQALLACVLLLLPLVAPALGLFRKRGGEIPGGSKQVGTAAVMFYFGALGFAFMFLEMAFIQKFMLYLSYPVLAVSVILTAMLFFAGLGSYFADRYRGVGLLPRTFAALALVSAVYGAGLSPLFAASAGLGEAWKILLSVLLLGLPAFFMGIPFPTGLQRVSERDDVSVPWAWCVNGCASVVGATLGKVLAMQFGFRFLLLTAVVLYGVATIAYPALTRDKLDG
ncbi:SAM-dependent methyltransferase [Sulfidibacter corallicola]|uniref:Spermine/spermidine synthase n=1 Tax=Sulfidibacter corallicola TaxID=2818388 RepID=A0A8A4TBW5_SULCO|nr:hypothetical protein [Sulfidibacter corallicola]QTD47609.1 hypothetical protein J3U87_18615 [Sulfidibacter corallicola]